MPDSSEEAKAERAQSILALALQEAKIEERRNLDELPFLHEGTKICWQKIGDDVELVFKYSTWRGEKLHASIFIKDLVLQIASLFQSDVEAVKALVDALNYIQAVISNLLSDVSKGLIVRGVTFLEKNVSSSDLGELLRKHRENLLKPEKSKIEMAMKQLRAEREKRGGSRPEMEVTDDQCALLSDNYSVLVKHWWEIRRRYKVNPSGNWRDHAKVDQPDTPDDLLNRVFDLDPYVRKPSAIALEHAARRCGIPANTYSFSNLARFRRRGDKFRVQSKDMID
jgi:hypothetical protein